MQRKYITFRRHQRWDGLPADCALFWSRVQGTVQPVVFCAQPDNFCDYSQPSGRATRPDLHGRIVVNSRVVVGLRGENNGAHMRVTDPDTECFRGEILIGAERKSNYIQWREGKRLVMVMAIGLSPSREYNSPLSAPINISDQGNIVPGWTLHYIGEFNYTYNTYVDKNI